MLIGLWGMCAKYQFLLRELGSPNLFNSFRFTDKAVQTHTLLGSGVPRWPFHYFFERNGYPMGNWMDGKSLWSSSCLEMVGRLVSGSPPSVSVLKKKGFSEPRGCVSKWTGRKQSHVSFIFCCVPFATFPYVKMYCNQRIAPPEC